MSDKSRKKIKNLKISSRQIAHEDKSVKKEEESPKTETISVKKDKIDQCIEWIQDHLPGGDFRVLDRIVDEHNKHLQKLKDSLMAKENKWWRKIPVLNKILGSKGKAEDIKTIQQLEDDIKYLKRKLNWLSSWGVIISFAAGFAFSTVAFSSLTGKFLSFLLERNTELEEDISGADIAIVIADDKKKNESGRSASDILDDDSLRRLNAALQFAKEKHLPILLSGSEKALEAMKSTAIGLGMSPEHIYSEESSKDVKEKAVNSRKSCNKLGFESPVLFTTAYKMPRTLCEFRRQGLAVKPFAVSQSNLGINRQTITDAVEYNPAMVKAAAVEYVKYIFSGCAF